jgi:D-tyrosyl-tRNA(Tyr) deacylase
VRAVIQRVSSASVSVGGRRVGAIEKGLCVLVGVTHHDDEACAERLAAKIWHLRVFEDPDGRVNLSAADLGLAVLVVSQFTLYADASRGRRPSFGAAAGPEHAEPLIERFVEALEAGGASVSQGRFGERMGLTLTNDGPFTVLVET